MHDQLKADADRARVRTFEYLLQQPGRGEAIFTVGGPGSGKKDVYNSVRRAEFVFDSVHADAKVLGDRIQAVLDSGRTAQVTLIVRDPGEAMSGNLSRALKEARVASAEGLARSHSEARAAFKAVSERFGGNPKVRLQALDSSTLQEITVPSLTVEEANTNVQKALKGITNGTDPTWTYGELPPALVERVRQPEP